MTVKTFIDKMERKYIYTMPAKKRDTWQEGS